MSRPLSVADGPAFLRLMKHYVMDYTNSHDQGETPKIMEADYALRMGPYDVVGRDTAYRAATRKQMDQFPGLILTVHEIWTSGERLMMRFSEHGASIRHGGAITAWGGIGLYVWNGDRLVKNFVEQDYASRARQMKSGIPNPVESPATAPWDTKAEAPDPAAEAAVRAWLKSGRLARTPGVLCDDAWTGAEVEAIVEPNGVIINDLFSCGSRVGFHATQTGALLADFAPTEADVGRKVELHMAGIVHVADGAVATGRIIRNRLDLQRTLGPR
ncbi:MAG: hypothetical protein PSV23_12415 [Brevundimonas sp.]|uniref:hypothetical protein n=1 Tax=Brevundimonas sp. TaxID=1871086 RepID=UPI002489F2E5|nr:hypothetical protein [Brevundimonas sp.]MDI1327587.1 hypothetical protein [Brevundimonas sp.]